MTQLDTAFQLSTSNLRFGAGTTREVGMDLEDMGLNRALLVIDPRLLDLPPGQTVRESLKSARIDFETFTAVEVEPTDHSFQEAILRSPWGRQGFNFLYIACFLVENHEVSKCTPYINANPFHISPAN